MRNLGFAVALATVSVAAPAGADVRADVKVGVDAWARGDFRTAVAQWRPAAIAGDADAQFNLAQAYKLGRGVPVDPALAQSWFAKAAAQGHHLAEDNYGIALFEAGRRSEAAPWLEKSVARDEPRTQLVYGTMLFNGDGVPRDVPRAYALMTRASQQGSKPASETLAQMDQFVSPADREKGTRLAQQYAAQARALPPAGDAAPGAPSMARTDLPPSTAAAPARPRAIAPKPAPAAKPGPAPKPVAAAPAPAPNPTPPKAVAKAPPATGGWRVQLGAFSTRANAETQWSRVRARMTGAEPAYVPARKFTRLQAGGFATRAAAQQACAKAGTACVVVAP